MCASHLDSSNLKHAIRDLSLARRRVAVRLRRALVILRYDDPRPLLAATADRIAGLLRRAAIHRPRPGVRAGAESRALPRRAAETLQPGPPPAVSVIIPVYNAVLYVRQCIESLYASPVQTPFEVIAIDQGSDDGALAYLREVAARQTDFHLIENRTNVGFPQAVNQGASAARGEYLACINSDVILTPGWLDYLVAALRDDPTLAVVSPMTNYVGHGPQIDPAACALKPDEAAAYANKIAARPSCEPVTDPLVFFAVLINRRAFELLGGMSGAFGLGNYEDDDFCLRARIAGFKLALAPRAFVFHYGSKTFKDRGISYQPLMLANQKIYCERAAMFATSWPAPRTAMPPESPAITVIVRTKDRPALLRQALLSLANQTFAGFEVVVVNDGGPDVSEVLDRLPSNLAVRQLAQEVPIGRSAALNVGLAAARGRWITYLDDDDIVYPTHLEILLGTLSRQEAPIAYTDTSRVLCWSDMRQDTVVDRLPYPERPFDSRMLLVENWIPIMSFMHAAACVQALGGFDASLSLFEDWDFLIRLAQRYPFQHIPRITCEYRYRFGAGNETGASTLQRRQEVVHATQALYARYPVTEAEYRQRRAATLAVLQQDIAEMQWIIEREPDPLRRDLLLTAYLGRFPNPEAYARHFGG